MVVHEAPRFCLWSFVYASTLRMALTVGKVLAALGVDMSEPVVNALAHTDFHWRRNWAYAAIGAMVASGATAGAVFGAGDTRLRTHPTSIALVPMAGLGVGAFTLWSLYGVWSAHEQLRWSSYVLFAWPLGVSALVGGVIYAVTTYSQRKPDERDALDGADRNIVFALSMSAGLTVGSLAALVYTASIAPPATSVAPPTM